MEHRAERGTSSETRNNPYDRYANAAYYMSMEEYSHLVEVNHRRLPLIQNSSSLIFVVLAQNRSEGPHIPIEVSVVMEHTEESKRTIGI